MLFEPETTVGRAKELIWNAWPNGMYNWSDDLRLHLIVCYKIVDTDPLFPVEWQDERPPAPSYLRILYLGKILQDDDTLTSELPVI